MKKAKEVRFCRIRGCQNKLAVQNKSGFCASCQQGNWKAVVRLDPKLAVRRRAYFKSWREANVKKYGKTRPSPQERKAARVKRAA